MRTIFAFAYYFFLCVLKIAYYFVNPAHDVLVAMALRALPLEFTNRMVVESGGISWDGLYASCGVWETAGLDRKSQAADCFSVSRNHEVKKEVKQERKCFFCKRKGHFMKDCFEFKKRGQGTNAIMKQEEKNESINELVYRVLSVGIDKLKSPEITIDLNGRSIKAILDTGSEVSLLDESCAGGLLLEKSNTKIRAANNEVIEVLGMANNQFMKWKRFTILANLLVCKGLNRECILGLDVMNKHRIGLCIEKDSSAGLGVHEIETEGKGPVAIPFRRYSCSEEEEIKRQLDEWKSKGIIRESYSPWRSPLVLVPKKNGKWRMCNDFRGLNKITKGDGYVLPWIDDVLDALAGAKIFSKMDAKSGYHQVDIKESDKEKRHSVASSERLNIIRCHLG